LDGDGQLSPIGGEGKAIDGTTDVHAAAGGSERRAIAQLDRPLRGGDGDNSAIVADRERPRSARVDVADRDAGDPASRGDVPDVDSVASHRGDAFAIGVHTKRRVSGATAVQCGPPPPRRRGLDAETMIAELGS
jgi:hypothetical protein